MSIRERALANGTKVYDVCIDLPPVPSTGKRRQERRTFRTKTEGRGYERERRTEVKQGRAIARTKLSFGDYLQTWLADVVALRCATTTATQYRWVVAQRITPVLGHIVLADLTTGRLQRFIADLARTPTARRTQLSRRSVEETYRLLHMALQAAVRQRLIPVNPADGVSLPRADRSPQREAWTTEEARRFLAVASQDAYEPLWTLALLTGLRRAELLGLRWRDIDWDAGTATIRQTVTKAGSRPTTKPPKNPTSRRPVPLSAETLALLAAHRQRQRQHIEECLDAYEDNDLICPNAYGQAWYPDTVSHRFKRLVELAGVRAVNLHYTRHTYASLALAQGETLAAVSEVLGHADRRTTLGFYQHVEQRQRQGVAETVSGLLMSHRTANVTCNVTNQEEETPSGAIAPERVVVRPVGLEPATFRSAI